LLDVVVALRGADDLRNRLLTTLQAGTPSATDLVYAVNTRVKEDYKATDKIKDKRAGKPPEDEPRPDYRVHRLGHPVKVKYDPGDLGCIQVWDAVARTYAKFTCNAPEHADDLPRLCHELNPRRRQKA